MQKNFQDLPNWTFWVDEISVGIYNVKGKNKVFGSNLDLTGEDPEELLQQARSAAAEMDRQTSRKIN